MVSMFLLLFDSMKVFESEREREREREREFSRSSHLVWRKVEQNENGFSKRVSKDFIRKLVF